MSLDLSYDLNQKKICQRKEFLSIRKNISRSERIVQSEAVARLLFETKEYKNAKSVFLYISVREEVSTDMILKKAFADNKKIAVPLCDVKNHTMTPIEISSVSQLKSGAYGILEPDLNLVEKGILNPVLSGIDLAIIPGAAFDKYCRRMGMGGGYYDRYLKNFKGLSVGLVYQECLADSIITDKYDQSVSMVIHPEGVIYNQDQG